MMSCLLCPGVACQKMEACRQLELGLFNERSVLFRGILNRHFRETHCFEVVSRT